MARAVDIERMSYDQLQELSQKVDAAKKDRKSEEAKAVKQKISHLLKRSGFTILELYGITTGSKSSAKNRLRLNIATRTIHLRRGRAADEDLFGWLRH